MNTINSRSVLKQVTGSYIGYSNVQHFSLWAFGKKIDCDFYLDEIKANWNERHSDIFIVDEENNTFCTYLRMIDIWKINFTSDFNFLEEKDYE